MASARAASAAADRVVVPVVAGRRRRPAFFNAAPAGPRKAACPPRRRSPPRVAPRARPHAVHVAWWPRPAPSRWRPPAAARPALPRIRPCWRVTARSWPEGGVAFGRG